MLFWEDDSHPLHLFQFAKDAVGFPEVIFNAEECILLGYFDNLESFDLTVPD